MAPSIMVSLFLLFSILPLTQSPAPSSPPLPSPSPILILLTPSPLPTCSQLAHEIMSLHLLWVIICVSLKILLVS